MRPVAEPGRRWSRLRIGRAPCLVLGALLASRAAGARESSPVVLLASTSPTLAKRLRGELAMLGFAVVLDDAGPQAPEGERPGATALRTGAAIVVRTTARAEGIEVVIVDRITGKTLIRDVFERELATADPDGVVALRVVELLRASLLELESPHPSRGDVEPSSGVLRATRPDAGAASERAHASRGSDQDELPDSFLDLVAAMGGASSVSATGISPTSALEAWWQTPTRLALGAVALIPAGPGAVRSDTESADVYASVLALGARLRLSPRPRRWHVSVGAAAALTWLHLSAAHTTGTHVARVADLWLGGPYADVALGWCFVPTVCASTALRGTVPFPAPFVSFAGREVAELGRPLLAWTLGLEIRAAARRPAD